MNKRERERERKNVIPSSELQRSVGTVLRRVAVDGESLVVERDGYPIVVMVPYHEYRQIMSRLAKKSHRETAPATSQEA
jgi:prevent-host-death family protein